MSTYYFQDSENISTASTSTFDDSLYEFVPDDNFSKQFFASSTPKQPSEPLKELQEVCFVETQQLEGGSQTKKQILGSVFPKVFYFALFPGIPIDS